MTRKDGPAAGQTVPHVHIHVIPRKRTDYADNDEVYDHLEHSERTLNATLKERFPKTEEKDRMPRTEEEMAKEAAWLAKFFDLEANDGLV